MSRDTADAGSTLARWRCIAAWYTLWSSTIGKKAIMAATGLLLIGFNIAHAFGSLKLFLGEAEFNAYAHWLRTMASPPLAHGQALWMARAALLAAVTLHIVTAVQLTVQSYLARPTRYRRHAMIQATLSSRTMHWGGLAILGFVIFHLLHFTWGQVGFPPGQYTESVYRNVVRGFSVWYASLIYLAALAALGFHIRHGVWSMFQTLGFVGARRECLYLGVSLAVALGVVLGYAAVPVAVLLGIVR
ncbi:MAG: succinate dehydrogenase cytochrome b subunit [Candidatus Methylomirabilota bacterium]